MINCNTYGILFKNGKAANRVGNSRKTKKLRMWGQNDH